MTNFVIEHQCPQCGAPAELEETDRLFRCRFCRVGSYLYVPDVFRYILSHNAQPGKELIYFPYWRFKGMIFTCLAGKMEKRFLDVSQQAVPSAHFPLSLGFRSQTQKLRFAATESAGTFLKPTTSKAELLKGLNDRLSAGMSHPILHQAYIGETLSLIYAPFYLGEKLIDALLNEPISIGNGSPEAIASMPRQEPDWPITFIPTLCPQCGWDLTGESDTLVLSCPQCKAIWRPHQGKLAQLNAAHVPGTQAATVYLPFWRVEADVSGTVLNSYADLIRVANLPRVVQPGWNELPFYFWCPAFKARPQSFLNFAAHITAAQPREDLSSGPPQGASHGVNLPLQEAVETLKLIMASLMRPQRRMEAVLPTLRTTVRQFTLIYLPFQDGPHELVHTGMNLAISKNLLIQARNL